jgi:hypothetical protein
LNDTTLADRVQVFTGGIADRGRLALEIVPPAAS